MTDKKLLGSFADSIGNGVISILSSGTGGSATATSGTCAVTGYYYQLSNGLTLYQAVVRPTVVANRAGGYFEDVTLTFPITFDGAPTIVGSTAWMNNSVTGAQGSGSFQHIGDRNALPSTTQCKFRVVFETTIVSGNIQRFEASVIAVGIKT